MRKIFSYYWTRRFRKYAFRWQLSSLTLAPIMYIPGVPTWLKVIIGNLVGAIIFYPYDDYHIFKSRRKPYIREDLDKEIDNIVK